MRTERIEEAVRKVTKQMLSTHKFNHEGADAESIALDLKLDRANVSRILNELWKNGSLIKIQGRPILFVDAELIRGEYPNTFIPSTIAKNAVLGDYLSQRASSDKEHFQPSAADNTYNQLENFTGADGSLKEGISKAIAAVSYPPYGLPVLLTGHFGTGRRRLALSLFQYCQKKKMLPKDSKFMIINCPDYADNDDLFARRLLGTARRASDSRAVRGTLEECAGGFIYFDCIETLSRKSCNLIADIIRNGVFSRIGESGVRPLNCHILAGYTSGKNEALYSSLEEFFPIELSLPDFKDRTPSEKIQLVLELFSREARSTKQNFYLNRAVVLLLANADYPDNEMQLRNEIRSTCARACLAAKDTQGRSVPVELDHLSNRILAEKNVLADQGNLLVRTLNMFDHQTIIATADGRCEALTYFRSSNHIYSLNNREQFADTFSVPLDEIPDFSRFICNMLDALRTADEDHLDALVDRVHPEVDAMLRRVLSSDSFYADILADRRVYIGLSVMVSQEINRASVNEHVRADSHYRSIHTREYQTAEKIVQEIKKKMPAGEENLLKDFICCYLYLSHAVMKNTKPSILVICHGNHTASEMVQYASAEAKDAGVIVSALDVRPGIQFNDLLEVTANLIMQNDQGAGTAVLVDTSPLDSMEEWLRKRTGSEVRVISSVSLNGLLHTISACGRCEPVRSFSSDFLLQDNAARSQDLTDQQFIDRFVSNVVSKTALFVNPQRAAQTLLYSLQIILDHLNMEYSEEIAVKYLSHGIHMIERIVKGNPLPYYHLKQFTNENYRLMDIIYKSLQATENTFDIKIPTSELAYLTEIFLNL